ncbi:YSIRK-type signal peptide-containing protein [Staphylococcus coagulans]|uniref:YSIRK-type signal peptide-containing protein n=1 Tax=Staphylococcus coagulans TaxID=74706 RepID=UPI002871E0C0|nr:YSIRK-type signal peptide-containing protein [Staphylococcus coagulans]MDR9833014.1 YSIRK-type signal peptide-containing protein [Staphylococcus coagulans]
MRKSKRLDFLPNKLNKYSIRKFTVGTTSILIGSLLYLGINNDVEASEAKTQVEKNNQSVSINDPSTQANEVNTEKINNENELLVSESNDVTFDNELKENGSSVQVEESKADNNNEELNSSETDSNQNNEKEISQNERASEENSESVKNTESIEKNESESSKKVESEVKNNEDSKKDSLKESQSTKQQEVNLSSKERQSEENSNNSNTQVEIKENNLNKNITNNKSNSTKLEKNVENYNVKGIDNYYDSSQIIDLNDGNKKINSTIVNKYLPNNFNELSESEAKAAIEYAKLRALSDQLNKQPKATVNNLNSSQERTAFRAATPTAEFVRTKGANHFKSYGNVVSQTYPQEFPDKGELTAFNQNTNANTGNKGALQFDKTLDFSKDFTIKVPVSNNNQSNTSGSDG